MMEMTDPLPAPKGEVCRLNIIEGGEQKAGKAERGAAQGQRSLDK
jgi:hypothetical protein